MTITKETAARALRLIEFSGGIGQAAHECEITLTSIRPYSDARTEKLLRLLNMLYRAEVDGKLEPLMTKLREIAAPAEVSA